MRTTKRLVLFCADPEWLGQLALVIGVRLGLRVSPISTLEEWARVFAEDRIEQADRQLFYDGYVVVFAWSALSGELVRYRVTREAERMLAQWGAGLPTLPPMRTICTDPRRMGTMAELLTTVGELMRRRRGPKPQLAPCPHCGNAFGARAMDAHKPQCAWNPRVGGAVARERMPAAVEGVAA